jgi:hypothetical protein
MKVILFFASLMLTVVSQAQAVFEIKSPPSIKGFYNISLGDSTVHYWGNGSIAKKSVNAELKLATGADSLASATLNGNYNGKIAVIFRGGVSFAAKALKAQAAGAVGVIIVNHGNQADGTVNGDEVFTMAGGTSYSAGDGAFVTIPVVMISKNSYLKLSPVLRSAVSVTGYIGGKQSLDYDLKLSPDLLIVPAKSTRTKAMVRQGMVSDTLGFSLINNGDKDQYNIGVRALIVKGLDTLYNRGVFVDTIFSKDTIGYYFFGDQSGTLPFRPTNDLDTGRYDLTFSVVNLNEVTFADTLMDQFDQDNVVKTSFYVTDSIYSIAKMASYKGSNGKTYNNVPVWGTATRPGSTYTNYSSCIVYKDNNLDNIEASGMTFMAYMTAGVLKDNLFKVNVFEWNDQFVDNRDSLFAFNDLNPLVDNQEYISKDSLTWDYQTVKFDQAVKLNAGQRYLFCVTTSNPNVMFGFDDDAPSLRAATLVANREPLFAIAIDGKYYAAGWGPGYKIIPTISVKINDQAPVCQGVNIEGDTLICKNNSIQLNSTVPGGTWSTSDNTTISVTNGLIKGLKAGKATITYTVTGSGACAGKTLVNSKIITVNNLPTVPVVSIGGSTTICEGNFVQLSTTSNASFTKSQWKLDGVNIANAVNLTHQAKLAGKYTVEVKNNFNCSALSSEVLVSVVKPSVTISGPSVICLGDTVRFTASQTGGTWSVLNSTIASANNGIVSGKVKGKTSVVYSYPGTGICLNKTLNVNFPIEIDKVAITPSITLGGSSVFCSGSFVMLYSDTIAGYTYEWRKYSIPILNATSMNYKALNEGIYTLVVRNSNNCSSVSAPVTLSTISNNLTISGENGVCVGSTTTLTPSKTGGSWSTTTPTIGTVTNGNVKGLLAGVSKVTYTQIDTETGCKGTATKNITVEAAPSVTISGPSKICWNGRAMFRASVAGGEWSVENSALLLASPQGLFRNSVKPATDNFKSGVNYTVKSSSGFCTVKAIKAVWVRNVTAPSITLSAPVTSIKVNGITTATATTSITSVGTWSSTNTIVSATPIPTNTKTATIKGLRVGSGANVVYFAEHTATGCRQAGYMAFNVTLASSLVDNSDNKIVTSEEASIYPNPSNGRVSIENLSNATKVNLVDMTGRILYSYPVSANLMQLDLTHISKGKYLLEIQTNDGNTIKPLVIE